MAEAASSEWMTAAETAAWVATRDVEFAHGVKELSALKLSLRWRRFRELQGPFWEADPRCYDRAGDPSPPAISVVLDQIRDACRCGQLSAKGYSGDRERSRSKQLNDISSADWLDLVIGQVPDFLARPDSGHGAHSKGEMFWRGLKFRRADVERCFPLIRAHETEISYTERRQLSSGENRKAALRLANILKKNHEMRRQEAFAIVVAENPDISETGFRSHVWPRAREFAGLPVKASAGRPSRSAQQK